MTFSDETLLAYLNGNLDGTDAQEIESAVEADPELEQRLMALDPFAPVVHSVFKDVPQDAPQITLPDRARSQPASQPFRLLAVAASVAIVAVSATLWATRPAPLGWAQQAAIYQSLYVPETIATLDTAPEALEAQFAQAEATLGRPLNREALSALPGAELKRAQVLSFKGKPLVQVVFADDQGRPFAFCVIRQGPGAPDKDVNLAVLSGLATATWAEDGYGYMIIGADGQSDLSDRLTAFSEAIAS
ncbi:hypothetical protein J7394_03515 [Ruegeria sp. R13_0]|uniref:hypothetical protein n=1 Tax=Ruegeria sp. R13_0 TaxID=2821099 RepID=UPI001ADBD073|nr:hypothetical protein [Ruegeria sp. R13_0]MBO9433258.1 hypothetical protein [Ruegeria sp. R13_0]